MKIAPRTGLVVIDPATSQPLSADGADVEMDSYWVRRLKDGDVTQVEEQEPVAEEPPRKNKKKSHARGPVDVNLVQQHSGGGTDPVLLR